MSLPSPSPPSPGTLPGGGEGAELVTLVVRHWGALAKLAGVLVAALLAWTALSGRVERVEVAQQSTAQDVAHLREAAKEDRSRDEARFTELDRQREEQAKSLAVLQTRLDAMDRGLTDIKATLAVILDRLGEHNAAARRSPRAATSP